MFAGAIKRKETFIAFLDNILVIIMLFIRMVGGLLVLLIMK